LADKSLLLKSYTKIFQRYLQTPVGCVAQLAERRSLVGELTLSCARPSADGWPLCG